MPKVYLSAPYHWYNKCAIDGCDENTHNNLYLDELAVYLNASGIETKRGYRRPPQDSTTDGDELMYAAVRESDAWGADVHYISHTNAFDGTVRGYRPMIYPGSVRGEALAKCMVAERRKIYDQPISLVRRSDLYELRVPAAASYYEEHVFHDNKADAEWFHANLRAIAESSARGMCAYFAIPFVDPYAEQAEVPAAAVAVGDEVVIKAGAVWYTGAEVPDWVISQPHTVDELDGDRAVLDKAGICSPIHVKYLDRVIVVEEVPESGAGETEEPAPAPEKYRIVLGEYDTIKEADAALGEIYRRLGNAQVELSFLDAGLRKAEIVAG